LIRTDNHSHIILADIREMVAAASNNELANYAITEHISQFREMRQSVGFGSVHRSGRIFEDFKEYKNEFSKIDKPGSSGPKVRQGLEVDFAPRYMARVGDYVNQEDWDILLCSVHELSDGGDVEGNKIKRKGVEEARQLWLDYFGLQNAAIESGFVPFSVLTHPVRLFKGTRTIPNELDDLLLDLAKAAKRKNKALELNGKDLDYAPQLVRRLAKACSEAGCMVSLGSDAHHPNEVFRNMTEAMNLVLEFGLQPISI
jgi:histidinol-phosphatase (PHP family)